MVGDRRDGQSEHGEVDQGRDRPGQEAADRGLVERQIERAGSPPPHSAAASAAGAGSGPLRQPSAIRSTGCR